MGHIKIKQGLDIPIKGKPEGNPKLVVPYKGFSQKIFPSHISLNVCLFDTVKFKVLVKEDDQVQIGQPLLEDKECPGRFFVSPAGGTIREIRRGLKRRLLDIVIEVSENEKIQTHTIAPLNQLSRSELTTILKEGGLFTHIYQRPFNFLADPNKSPRSIFIKALESAPFTPPAEMQVEGYEREFQEGLNGLKKLTEGSIYLIHRKGTQCRAFLDAVGVEKYSAEGPHPISNASIHIEQIDPIRTADDIVWTLNAHAVVAIGYFLLHGRYFVPRIVSVAGPGMIENQIGYYKIREGFPLAALLTGKIKNGSVRLVSGDPLMGHQVNLEDFIGYEDTVVCAIPDSTSRKFLHFFRLGMEDYTFSGAYLTGHLDHTKKDFSFTTNQHGEERPFIDATLYDDVMPMRIATMPLIKALLAEDYDLAAQLGLLEVDKEDFALATFVCPSKIEMVEIVDKGIKKYAADVLK